MRIGVAVGVALLLSLLILRSGTISQSTALSIKGGMTEVQVKAVAGDPYAIKRDGWYYRVMNGLFPFSDPLVVSFDDRGAVCETSF